MWGVISTSYFRVSFVGPLTLIRSLRNYRHISPAALHNANYTSCLALCLFLCAQCLALSFVHTDSFEARDEGHTGKRHKGKSEDNLEGGVEKHRFVLGLSPAAGRGSWLSA